MRVVASFVQKIFSQNFQKAVIKSCEFIKGIENGRTLETSCYRNFKVCMTCFKSHWYPDIGGFPTIYIVLFLDNTNF